MKNLVKIEAPFSAEMDRAFEAAYAAANEFDGLDLMGNATLPRRAFDAADEFLYAAAFDAAYAAAFDAVIAAELDPAEMPLKKVVVTALEDALTPCEEWKPAPR